MISHCHVRQKVFDEFSFDHIPILSYYSLSLKKLISILVLPILVLCRLSCNIQWRFPKMDCTPYYHPFEIRIFSTEKNTTHLMGTPMAMETTTMLVLPILVSLPILQFIWYPYKNICHNYWRLLRTECQQNGWTKWGVPPISGHRGHLFLVRLLQVPGSWRSLRRFGSGWLKKRSPTDGHMMPNKW